MTYKAHVKPNEFENLCKTQEKSPIEIKICLRLRFYLIVYPLKDFDEKGDSKGYHIPRYGIVNKIWLFIVNCYE